MRYMLLVYSDESCWTDSERQECMIQSLAICDELTAQGKFIDASPLESVGTATTVQIRKDQTLIFDGPFAETREQLGGYFIIDVPDLDEAISIARRLPAAAKGSVEIRPLFDLASLNQNL